MTIVSRDATSGHWFPGSAAECASLLSGTGIATPTSLWLMQEASGTSLADSIGSQPLTMSPPTLSMAFAVAVDGWTRKGAQTNGTGGSGTAAGSGNFDGPIGDLSNPSMVAFLLDVPTVPTTHTNVMTFNETFAIRWDSSSGHARPTIYDYTTNTDLATGTENYEGGAHVFVFQVDTVNLVARIVTELETISATITLDDISGGAAFVFGDNGAFTSNPSAPDETSIYMGGMGWTGIDAEKTSAGAPLGTAHLQVLVDRLWNGPAYDSIAVEPSSVTLEVNAYQTFVGFVTRVDGSTDYVGSEASWSSGNTSVAISAAGEVFQCIGYGDATITASIGSLFQDPVTGTATISTPTVAIPSVGTDVPDLVAQALSRLLQQDKGKPKLAALVTTLVQPFQDVVNACWQLSTQYTLEDAIGAQLDSLGKIVDVDRDGMTDSDYLVQIRAQLAILRSKGRTEDLISVASIIASADAAAHDLPAPLIVVETYHDTSIGLIIPDAEVEVRIAGTAFGAYDGTLPYKLFELLDRATGGGVSLLLRWSASLPAETFTFDTGQGFDTSNLAGATPGILGNGF